MMVINLSSITNPINESELALERNSNVTQAVVSTDEPCM